MADPNFRVEIAAKTQVAEEIFEFVFVPVTGEELPPTEPGAHIDVLLNEQLTRQYSLTNGPEETGCYKIAVLRDPGGRGGSVYLCDNYQVGDLLSISAPRNLFPLKAADEYILLAGGIGITPIFSMLKQEDIKSSSYQFYYMVRSQSRAAFLPELTALCGEKLKLHCDEQGDNRPDLNAILGPHQPGKHLYVCGPEGLIKALEQQAAEAGWPSDHIHYELFNRSEPLHHDSDGDFVLNISGTDTAITVAADETALEALHRSGFDIPCSCEQGVCGSCLLQVADGMPDHRDMFLTDEERAANNSFTPCCSRALTSRLEVILPD